LLPQWFWDWIDAKRQANPLMASEIIKHYAGPPSSGLASSANALGSNALRALFPPAKK
jgi:hypothetical protein